MKQGCCLRLECQLLSAALLLVHRQGWLLLGDRVYRFFGKLLGRLSTYRSFCICRRFPALAYRCFSLFSVTSALVNVLFCALRRYNHGSMRPFVLSLGRSLRVTLRRVHLKTLPPILCLLYSWTVKAFFVWEEASVDQHLIIGRRWLVEGEGRIPWEYAGAGHEHFATKWRHLSRVEGIEFVQRIPAEVLRRIVADILQVLVLDFDLIELAHEVFGLVHDWQSALVCNRVHFDLVKSIVFSRLYRLVCSINGKFRYLSAFWKYFKSFFAVFNSRHHTSRMRMVVLLYLFREDRRALDCKGVWLGLDDFLWRHLMQTMRWVLIIEVWLSWHSVILLIICLLFSFIE